MKYLINNCTDKDLLHNFIETDDPVYVFNLLLRYFFYNMCAEDRRGGGLADIGQFHREEKIHERILYFSKRAEELKQWKYDHTMNYALDVMSNTVLLRQFLKYPWQDWEGKTVLEVGCGFGIYVYLFNLIKDYYNVDVQIKSYDLSEYKINKIKAIGLCLGWSNNKIVAADCCTSETFADCRDDDIALIYSETFGRRVGMEAYFKIMKNILHDCKDTIKPPYILFPTEFVIAGEETSVYEYMDKTNDEDRISHVKIDGVFQSLSGFEVDNKAKEIIEYFQETYPGVMGFRWWTD